VTSPAAVTPEVDPTEAGFDPERLARIDRHLERYVEAGLRKGTLVAITRGGKVVHVASAGERDAEAGLPVETDTIWRIYSMTKPITSVAAMTLYDEGAFSLFDPVAKFIPSFEHLRVYKQGPPAAPVTRPASEPMLMWHLLTHTAGLTYSFYFTHAVDAAYRESGFDPGLGREDYDLTEACERIASLPLLFEPGAEWNYSAATDVLGHVIEVISGRPLDEFFSDRIFEPLGMHETGFQIAEESTSRLAGLYAADPATGKAGPNPGGDPISTERPNFLAGGHGLASTLADYHRFTQMLLRRGELDGTRILSPRTVELMTKNHLPGGADLATIGRPLGVFRPQFGQGFGLGFGVVDDPVAGKSLSSRGEFHWGGAAGTNFWVDPAEEITALFFTQVLWAPVDLWAELRQLTYQALVA
jgi:CubicO group peptidase (beta-lactamase class C family)